MSSAKLAIVVASLVVVSAADALGRGGGGGPGGVGGGIGGLGGISRWQHRTWRAFAAFPSDFAFTRNHLPPAEYTPARLAECAFGEVGAQPGKEQGSRSQPGDVEDEPARRKEHE